MGILSSVEYCYVQRWERDFMDDGQQWTLFCTAEDRESASIQMTLLNHLDDLLFLL